MKVLLVNPNSEIAETSWEYRRAVVPILPQGIAYISAVLERNGIEILVIDQYAENMGNNRLIDRIDEEAPDIVGFSCLTAAMSNVARIIAGIRLLRKGIKVVLGNIHATVFADELLRDGLADVIVRGEGEESMLELVLTINQGMDLHSVKGISFMNGGEVCHNCDREAVGNLDELPYPAWHLFNLRNYKKVPLVALRNTIFPIQASRGCPYKCFFCSQEKMHKGIRYRKVESVVDEIECMIKKFGVYYFGFNDAYFPFSIEYGIRFCEELIRRGLEKKIKWITETRVDMVNLDLLRKMKKAGVHLIMYGFEVGNQEVLSKTGKRTTLEQAKEAMRMTKKAKILSLGLFMLGLPGETIVSCEDTIRFANELDCDIAKFNIAVPLPGSEFFAGYIGKKEAVGDTSKFTSWFDWSSLSNSGQLLSTPQDVSSRELVDLQRKAMFSFYLKPRIIFRHLFITSFSDLYFGFYILARKYLKSFFRRSIISTK